MDKHTEIVREKYNRIANVFDRVDHMIKPAWRQELLQDVSGAILETGVGTGANLPFYPAGANVTGIDFSPNMLAFAERKKAQSKANVTLAEMDIQQLHFPDNAFDAVVATCVFCSVPDPVKGLKEIRRVVKPDGKVLMLEHMRMENPVTGKLLDFLNPLSVNLIGVNINRRTLENIKKAGLRLEKQRFLMTSLMRQLELSPNK